MTDQSAPPALISRFAALDWQAGDRPRSVQFDDPYFSIDNGIEETRHVFLAGNDLPGRFGGRFRIAELGFGTGLNFLVVWQAWLAAGRPGQVHFTSFEAFPMGLADMARALGAFPELADLARSLLAELGHGGPYDFDGMTLDLVIGDVRDRLPLWSGQADAWFLDGFSPAKNPQMWEPAVLTEIAGHTVPGGTVATYTAAGHVRANLAAAGFEVTRQPGYGRKRHMTTARMPL